MEFAFKTPPNFPLTTRNLHSSSSSFRVGQIKSACKGPDAFSTFILKFHPKDQTDRRLFRESGVSICIPTVVIGMHSVVQIVFNVLRREKKETRVRLLNTFVHVLNQP